MKKTDKIILAVLLLPAVVGLVSASTNYIGQLVQQVDQAQIKTNPISTDEGPSDSGTQRVAIARSTTPINVSLQGGTTVQVTGLGGGNVLTSLQTPIPAGTNNIGTVSGSSVVASQGGAWNVGVNGSTVAVVNAAGSNLNVNVATPLPAGTNIIGQVTIDQSTPGVSNAVFVTNASTQTVKPFPSTVVTKSSVSATSVSSQLAPADPNRLGIECQALCGNNRDVFLNINSASAATLTDYPLPPCASWSPPAGLVPTGAIQVITITGSQGVRCVSYSP